MEPDPFLKDRNTLRQDWFVESSACGLGSYLVGSHARGTAHEWPQSGGAHKILYQRACVRGPRCETPPLWFIVRSYAHSFEGGGVRRRGYELTLSAAASFLLMWLRSLLSGERMSHAMPWVGRQHATARVAEVRKVPPACMGDAYSRPASTCMPWLSRPWLKHQAAVHVAAPVTARPATTCIGANQRL